MQGVEIGVDTCRSRCVHGNVRFGEKWGKGEGGGGVRVELKVMVESWDNDGMVVPSSAIVVLGRGSSLRRKMMSSVLVTLISQFLGHPRELIKLETVQSLESLGSSNKYMSVLEKVIKTVGYGTSLVVQWLRLHSPDIGDLGLIPGQGTRFHM